MSFKGNIEKLTLANSNYRRVLHTTSNQQLVLMSLDPGQEIGMERHPGTTQFIRIESGHGVATVNGKRKILKEGDVLVVDPGTWHNVKNTSNSRDMQLYTIYSPPKHKPESVQKYKDVS
jgi:mannose-6-phosphate isomerase-like protein (cupin superfamily)